MYEERLYRKYMKNDELIGFPITQYESDLAIFAKCNLEEEARKAVKKFRGEIIDYIKCSPEFLTCLTPISPSENAPEIIKHMCNATKLANVGPMASVAGAISRYAGLSLLEYSDEIIIENGGDIFLKSKKDKHILIYAGSSIFSNKLSLLIPGRNEEIGICTSSGTVGHSLSFGKADAAVIVSKDVLLADAVATATGNVVKSEKDIEKGLNYAMSIPHVEGAVIIVGEKMGAIGDIHLVKV